MWARELWKARRKRKKQGEILQQCLILRNRKGQEPETQGTGDGRFGPPVLFPLPCTSHNLSQLTQSKNSFSCLSKKDKTAYPAMQCKIHTPATITDRTGAPNENIVQNHLNMALLNVFQYLNGRYRHIFIPQKFSICSDFLAESLVIRKLQGPKLTFPKISARKKAPDNSR